MKKGIIKKVMSMGLAVAITATSVGFAPPAAEISKGTPSMAVKSLDSMATPSEAKLTKATPSQVESLPVNSSKATPSQATPSKATSSEANIKKTFVRVEPEEIPEYYNKTSYSGKKFWTFKDRNGSKQYRDYGFIQGDAEFPLWYVCNDKGVVDIESSINLDDEYYDLAPYIYKNAEPAKADWNELLQRLNCENSIENYNREETKRFKNWDSSTYTVWNVKGNGEDLGNFFYGSIINDKNSLEKWHYADEKGIVFGVFDKVNLFRENLLTTAKGLSQVKYYYANKETYPNSYTNYVSYIDDISKLGDDEYYEFITPPALSGHKFLGWSNWQCYEYGEKKLDIRMNPQNYDYDSHVQISSSFAHLIMPGTKIKKKYLKYDKLTAVWIPEGYETLVLLRDFDMFDPNDVLHINEYKNENWEKALWAVAVLIRKPGVTYNLSRLPDKNKKWHSTKFGADMGDWITETGERIVNSYTFKQKNGITYAYVDWIPSNNSVTFKDYYGNVIGDVQNVVTGNAAVAPKLADVPTPDGYVFAGWDKDFNDIHEDTVITAQYEAATEYKIALNGNGGNVDGKSSQEKTVTYNESFDQILADGRDEAARKYYSFAGWYTSAIGGTKYSYSGNKMPASDVTVYAHWIRTSNPVIIKDWNGNIIWTQDVGVGGTVTLPDPPERTGYTFVGWDNDGTNIQAETTITPKYTINSYKLTLDGNGGTIDGKSSQEKTVTYKESIDQLLTEGRDKASRKYYSFAGWYTSLTGGMKYSFSGNKMPAANVTVYAHWIRTSNPVIIKDWNGNIIWTQDVGVGGTVTLPEPPERTGYTFVGWDNNGTNIQSETTITALYKINHYKLTLDGNGGTVDGKDYKKQSVIYGDSFDSFLTNGNDKVIRQNYSFVGWYSAPTGGKKYAYKGNQMPDQDVTVYAHWKRDSYKVTYIDWTGTVLDIQEVAAGSDATAPVNSIRTGYTFTGWDKPSTNIQGATTIKALYKINHYKLTLDGNGGTVDGNLSKEQSVIYGDAFDYFLTNGKDKIIRQNYSFDGWYSAPTGGTVYSYSGNKMPDTDLTVYAHWIKIKTFIDNQDGTNTRPGADGQFGTEDDEIYASGPDGEPGTADDYKKDDIITPEPAEPEPTKPEPAKESSQDKDKDVITSPVTSIDSKVKAEVPDNGGTYTVNPDNPYDVTYTKEDGTPAKNEWVGNGEDWYHVNEKSKLDYNWFLNEKGTWYMLNDKPGENFGAALTDWYQESMDNKKYFFDPKTTEMLTGWQSIDGKWYYFTPRNEGQTYFGDNTDGWKYDPEKPGKPYGSMYQKEKTPDGYSVDENGVWIEEGGKKSD